MMRSGPRIGRFGRGRLCPAPACPPPGRAIRSMPLHWKRARHGAGVLMGHQSLVQGALDDGSLIAPFAAPVPTGKALVLEHPAFDPPRADPAQVLTLLAGQVMG